MVLYDKLSSTKNWMDYRKVFKYTEAAYNPGSIDAAEALDYALTITGVRLGDIVLVGFDLSVADVTYMGFVSAADSVTVRFINNHVSAARDPSAADLSVLVIRP